MFAPAAAALLVLAFVVESAIAALPSVSQSSSVAAVKPVLPEPLKFNGWRNCSKTEYKCGEICSPTCANGDVTLSLQYLKLCNKTEVEIRPCPEQGLMCSYTENEPAVCTRYRTERKPCPEPTIPVPVCNSSIVDEQCVPESCEKFNNVKCEYKEVNEPCKAPEASCKECSGNLMFRKCSRTRSHSVVVACPAELIQKETAAGKSPPSEQRATPSPTPMPSKESAMFASNARCLASLFDEEECQYADMTCQLFSDMFDSTACAVQVCLDCRQLRFMPVSAGLKKYCTEQLQSNCRTFYSIRQAVNVGRESESPSPLTAPPNSNEQHNVTYNAEDGKCYTVEHVKVSAPCNVELQSDKRCLNGCVVGMCTKKTRLAGYCRDFPPHECSISQECKKTKSVCMSVIEDRGVCDYRIPEDYGCTKVGTFKRRCRFSMTDWQMDGFSMRQGVKSGDQGALEQGAMEQDLDECGDSVQKKKLCGMGIKSRSVECRRVGCVQKYCTRERCTK